VPPDHFFVLGDSRDNARDSRYIGFVPKRNVIGVVIEKE
jgi:signal peptidase I